MQTRSVGMFLSCASIRNKQKFIYTPSNLLGYKAHYDLKFNNDKRWKYSH